MRTFTSHSCQFLLAFKSTPSGASIEELNMKKVLGFLAIAGLTFMGAPAERAQALSLINPGAASTVKQANETGTSEVHWRRSYGWRRYGYYGGPRYYRRSYYRPYGYYRPAPYYGYGGYGYGGYGYGGYGYRRPGITFSF